VSREDVIGDHPPVEKIGNDGGRYVEVDVASQTDDL